MVSPVRYPSNLSDLDIFVDKHGYHINGKSYARVTRVLDIVSKPEFYRWFGKHGYKACIKQRDDRAAFGTRVHKVIQDYFNYDLVPSGLPPDDELSLVFNVFLDWLSSHRVIPRFLEVHLFSDRFQVAGTCDFVGMFDGSLMVLDWKTSKRVYDTYPVQVAIYMSMFESMTGETCDGAGVVCFRHDGVHEKYIDRDRCLELVEVFGNMRECYRWKYKK
jgi:hypothetical protein